MRRIILLAFALAVPASLATAQGTDTTAAAADSLLPARPAEELRRAGLLWAPAVRTCYEHQGLAQDPALRGRVEVSFTVARSGTVSDVVVDTLDVSGVGMREVARCIGDVASRWHFASGDFAPELVLLPFDLLPRASRAATGPAAPPRTPSAAPPGPRTPR